MKVAIIANGTVNEIKSEWLDGVELIIAADGGANHCVSFGITPDFVIGDLDSASQESLKSLPSSTKIIQDEDQNKTDLMLAIELAQQHDASEYVLIGALGNRIDQTLANIMALSGLKDARIVDERNEVWFVNESISLHGKEDETISVIALADTTGLSYAGLKWNLNNQSVPFGWVGTSNLMTAEKASISIKTGRICVMKARD